MHGRKRGVLLNSLLIRFRSGLEAIAVQLENGQVKKAHLLVTSFSNDVEMLGEEVGCTLKRDDGCAEVYENRIRKAVSRLRKVSNAIEMADRFHPRTQSEFFKAAEEVVDLAMAVSLMHNSRGVRSKLQLMAGALLAVCAVFVCCWYVFLHLPEERRAYEQRASYVAGRIAGISALEGIGHPGMDDLVRTARILEGYYLEHGRYPLCREDIRPHLKVFSKCSASKPEWIYGLSTKAALALPLNKVDRKNPQEQMRYQYICNGQEYKLIAIGKKDCSREEDLTLKDVVDTIRPCKAVGIWTKGASSW